MIPCFMVGGGDSRLRDQPWVGHDDTPMTPPQPPRHHRRRNTTGRGSCPYIATLRRTVAFGRLCVSTPEADDDDGRDDQVVLRRLVGEAMFQRQSTTSVYVAEQSSSSLSSSRDLLATATVTTTTAADTVSTINGSLTSRAELGSSRK